MKKQVNNFVIFLFFLSLLFIFCLSIVSADEESCYNDCIPPCDDNYDSCLNNCQENSVCELNCDDDYDSCLDDCDVICIEDLGEEEDFISDFDETINDSGQEEQGAIENYESSVEGLEQEEASSGDSFSDYLYYDVSGEYTVYFYIAIVLGVIAVLIILIILFSFLKKPKEFD